MVEAGYEPPHPPVFRRCECVLHRDLLANADRALFGLSSSSALSSSPLRGREESNLVIRAGEEFLPHLRHVIIRKPITFFAKVISDAELVTAWLATIPLQGGEIRDADAYKVSTRYMTIPDLVVPPDLLVIRMGVKAARNAAAPEVLAEALSTRLHEGRPTWVWEEPHHLLGPDHIMWNDQVGRVLRSFELLKGLESPAPRDSETLLKGRRVAPTAAPSRKTLRGGG